MCFADIDFN